MKERGAAFEDAFESYADELFRHAYFRLSDRERAVDLVQDTYLKAYAYAERHDIEDMRAFLYRTLRNLVIDEYRKKKSVSLDAMAEAEEGMDAEAFMPADETNTLDAAADRLDARAALDAVHELPPSYAEALLLRYVDGLSPAEMGERLGVSENLASVRVHRALAELRKRLDHHTP
jgi:RNA polymerase sigma-70 factor (ECF subfamily)